MAGMRRKPLLTDIAPPLSHEKAAEKGKTWVPSLLWSEASAGPCASFLSSGATLASAVPADRKSYSPADLVDTEANSKG